MQILSDEEALPVVPYIHTEWVRNAAMVFESAISHSSSM